MWKTDKGPEVIAGFARTSPSSSTTSGDDFGVAMADATKGFAQITLGQSRMTTSIALFDRSSRTRVGLGVRRSP